ncbi:hypothetical protein MAPG_07002 [Magnaporthiopsis poae ATCC 64411]|uniref:Telomere-associated protein Rif1 N-terminal domain-containing protein n=1 Tax=Magnaporthiopsis poae (strain ATCC 64411 / 73-15) TaxID=644358 RepID=A0A0C4E3K0_MAGP6|nr:hypothetical protein MAPG_07002 [Magnaporthiopsis poae ATCC 64411]
MPAAVVEDSNSNSSSRLDHLEARPPTPPHKKTIEPDPSLLKAKPAPEPHLLDPRRALHTPPGNPSPAVESSRRKRVEFSAQAEYREHPSSIGEDGKLRQPTPASIPPPSSSTAAPVKSILKVSVSCGPNPLDPTDRLSPDGLNLPEMLESTVKQLAGSDRDDKVDAYTMLVRALKASKNLPDRIALQDKMPLLVQFVQRDITGKSTDMSLTNHAYQLLHVFLYFPAIASFIPNDAAVQIVDHCIRTLSDASLSKEMARNVLQIIGIQSFPPKVMTSDRVGKIVSAIRNIPEPIKDRKSTFIHSIQVYRRLVKQSKHHMAQHSDWLFDLFEAMLSTVKDIRSSAISLGKEAAFTIGREKLLSRKVLELVQLPSPSEEGKVFIEYYADNLKNMLKDKQVARFVPQIWSVTMLLLPNADEWKHFNDWLLIMQTCFNHPDINTKLEANRAWSRLVYTLSVGARSMPPKTLRSLTQPFQANQLRRFGNGKDKDAVEELRRVIGETTCVLFYYTFKFGVNLSNLDVYWDTSVKPVMQQPTDGQSVPDKQRCAQSVAILSGLFDCATQRVWREDRIADEATPITPAELPAIEAKWLRRNPVRVFGVVEPIIKQNYHELSNTRSATHKLWHNLIGSIASAASKEIKVSQETATFLGHTLGFLMRVWVEGVGVMKETDNGGSVQFLASTRELILVVIDKLGRLPFTEKVLAMNNDRTLVPISTPSHRSAKHSLTARPTMYHVFSILSTLPPGVPDNEEFTDFFRSIFSPLISERDAKGRKQMSQELMQMIPADALCPGGPWVLIAELAAAGLEPSQHSSDLVGSSNSDVLLGQEYRDIVKVLERGLRSTPGLGWHHWQSLFSSLVSRVRNVAGDAGVAITVVEPLAKSLLDTLPEDGSLPNNCTIAFAELISAATHPRDRQAIEAARRRLWGTAASGARSASCDPFDNLYRACNAVLQRLYGAEDVVHASAVTVLREVEAFMGRCNSQLALQTLGLLQAGFVPWIQDESTRLQSRQLTAVSEVTKSLWDRVCALVFDVEAPEMLPLTSIEPLLCAAFESKHRHVVNSVSTMWNKLFEKASDVAYPEKLKAVLISLHPFVDITLPGLDVSDSSAGGAQMPSFIDTQDDMEIFNSASTKSISPVKTTAAPAKSGKGLIPSVKERSTPRKSPRLSGGGVTKPPLSARRKTRSPTKLRHDDSQVQFEAIDSSPSDLASLESQVLTERQQEVRDRQKAAATLFPAIRSSPRRTSPRRPRRSSPRRTALDNTAKQSSPLKESHPRSPSPPSTPQAATPERGDSFQDFISSTPTPRRGQAVPLANTYGGVNDPPSSPPEARRYPLVPEINTRSRKANLLDDWQFSSSPITGSPEPVRRTAPAPEEEDDDAMAVDEEDGNLILDEPAGLPPAAAVEDLAAVESAVAEKTKVGSIMANLMANRAILEIPSTPRRSKRIKAVQETPKSDSEATVDTPTSPAKSSPAKKAAEDTAMEDTSFAVSEGVEDSMVRLVVELDGQSRPPPNFIEGTPSPTKGRKDKEISAGVAPTDVAPETDAVSMEGGRRRSKRGRGRPRRPGSSSTLSSVPSTPGAEKAESRVPTPASRRKRKRSSKAADDEEEDGAAGPKKAKQMSPELQSHGIPDSQVDLDAEVHQADEIPPHVDVAEKPEADVIPTEAEDPAAAASEVMEVTEMQPDEGTDKQGEPLEALSPRSTETDPEEQLQSQIAMEETESQRSQERATSAVAEAAVAPAPEPEIEAEDETKADEAKDEGEDDNNDDDGPVHPTAAIEAEAEANAQEPAETPQPAPSKSTFQTIMDMLRGGLGALRTANLPREEVYEIEDVCMDIKRELYAAEKRGRDN